MTEPAGGGQDRGVGDKPSGSLPSPHLSHSQVSTYRTCGEMYRLRYVEQVEREPNGAAIGGIAVHHTIQVSEEEELWRDFTNFEDDGVATGLFNAEFIRLVAEAEAKYEAPIRWGKRTYKAFPNGETPEWWFANGPEFLRRYAQVRRADLNAGMTLIEGDVERKVGAMVDDTLVIGYVDVILLADPNGEGLLRDWKTGTWDSGPTQLADYAWMLSQDEKRPWRIRRGQVGRLRSPKMEDRIKEYDLEPWIDLVPTFYRQARDGISAGFFPLIPSNLCGSCGVRKFCAWGRALDTAPEVES